MARPREFEEARVRETLMNVFWEKGYEGTSMQDLVTATGLLKGSLYGAFGDKQALYLVALEHYEHTQIQTGIEMLGTSDSAPKKIGRLFDTVVDSVKTGVFAGGCLLCNASIEMAAVDSNVRAAVQRQIRRLEKAVVNAIGTDAPKTDAETKKLAEFVVSTYFGARVIAKAGMPTTMIIAARDHCLSRVNQFI